MKKYTFNQIKDLPRKPGVYYFLNEVDKVLYVGKASSLRVRVSSYFERSLDRRLETMLKLACTVGVIITESSLEALILEANEIKKFKPPFNIVGKDDKTFVEIAITDEEVPKVILIRPTQRQRKPLLYTFGPYASASLARKALRALNKIFKFNCRGQAFSGQPCFNYHIGLCAGVCINKISLLSYRRTIIRVMEFLSGHKQQVLQKLERTMLEYARQELFEEAAWARDQLFALRHLDDTSILIDDLQHLLTDRFPKRIEAYDISNLGKSFAVGSMVVLNRGEPQPNQYRRFKIKTVKSQNDLIMLEDVLKRRFSHSEWPQPDFIFVDGGKAQLNRAEKVLQLYTSNIPAAGIIKGPKRNLAKLVFSAQAHRWLRQQRLTTQALEPVARLARDEAHRFALQYHRQLRSRSIRILFRGKSDR